jgi:7,8-dihydropterin-6-yl-methyl-4-(beta-D-ribofuranosyl)aminobenzene 5'-phosphate synthase
VRVTIAVDNLANDGLDAEHGLSILVESREGSLLFDTGQTEAVVRNLEALGADLERIEAIALSHGHYDHTGGLRVVMSLTPNSTCHAHPACFQSKYAASEQGMRSIGIPGSSTVADRVIRYNRGPAEVMPGMTLSGEIPFRAGIDILESRFLTDGSPGLIQDTFEDEQCLVVRGDSGTAVLLGCAHRGVENNVLAAVDVAGTDEIKLAVGGMHLGDADEARLNEVAEFFERTPTETIACCHCTGQEAYQYLRDRLGPRVILGRSGMSWEI